MAKTYGLGTIELRGARFRLRLPDGRGGYEDAGTFDTREEAEKLQASEEERLKDLL